MTTLLLRLVAPMQSWGHQSRFDHRDTGLEPTRSGVIGLLCAALGWGRDADLSPFVPLRMGVRVDAPGRVEVDFQTAMDVIKASGARGDTVTSHRYYLADARFLVGLEAADAAFLDRLEAALRAPRWGLFFGRKSFPPSLPLYLPEGGLRHDRGLEEALQREPWHPLWPWEAQPDPLRLILERGHTGGAPVGIRAERADAPLSFERRRFGLRAVWNSTLRDVPKGGVLPCTSHG